MDLYNIGLFILNQNILTNILYLFVVNIPLIIIFGLCYIFYYISIICW